MYIFIYLSIYLYIYIYIYIHVNICIYKSNLAALPVRPDDEVAVAVDQDDEYLPIP